MTDVCLGIKDKLEDAGVGTWKSTGAQDWNITIGKLPTTPERSVSVVRSGGLPPNPKYLLDYPSVQVTIRGNEKEYVETLAKAQLIKDTLLGLPSQDVNGDRWVLINMLGDVNPLGFDEKNRPLFSVNFSMIVEPAASGQSNRIEL